MTKWLDEAQEWVWTDALRVGDRAYHASCYAEVTKDGGNTPMYGGRGARATPDRVLGKRKAEVSLIGRCLCRVDACGANFLLG